MQEIKKDEKLISSKEFYETTLCKQRCIINQCIRESIGTGNPIIKLPFDTYPQIEEEMDALGWEYDYYKDEANNKCAMFYPKQYNYDCEEDDEEECDDDEYEIVEDEGTTYKKRRKHCND